MRLVFFGTAEFAVPCLEALVTAGHTILAVVTAPDKPAGRGYALKGSPVKETAERLGLRLLQPEKLKATEFIEQLANLAPQLQVVVAFRMLPEIVWNAPPLGTVNVHGSLLPQYRGAAPIHWAVANGEEETGVTSFFLRHEIDTGDLIFQDHTPIGPNETTGHVYERLMHMGASLIVKTVDAIQAGTAPRLPQVYKDVMHHAPKITSENSRADFTQPAEVVRNLIRGMNPFPTAWTLIHDKQLKLHIAKVPTAEESPADPTKLGAYTTYQNRLYVGCSDGWLELTEVQPEGKRKMTGSDFLNGAGRGLV
jgi:methionyl-tRNA formyltransferase